MTRFVLLKVKHPSKVKESMEAVMIVRGEVVLLFPFRNRRNYEGYERELVEMQTRACGCILCKADGSLLPESGISAVAEELENQYKELKSYKPAQRGFTSKEEMEKVADILGLKTSSPDELCIARDLSVTLYNKWCDEIENECPDEREMRERIWDMHEAMQSVTAVVDHYKWNRGMEV